MEYSYNHERALATYKYINEGFDFETRYPKGTKLILSAATSAESPRFVTSSTHDLTQQDMRNAQGQVIQHLQTGVIPGCGRGSLHLAGREDLAYPEDAEVVPEFESRSYSEDAYETPVTHDIYEGKWYRLPTEYLDYRVLTYIRDAGSITMPALYKALDIFSKAAYRAVARLEAKGRVKTHSSGSSGGGKRVTVTFIR